MQKVASFFLMMSLIPLPGLAVEMVVIRHKHKSRSFGQASTTTYSSSTQSLSELRGLNVNLDVLYDNVTLTLYLIDHKRKLINKIDKKTLEQSQALVQKVKKMTDSHFNLLSKEQKEKAKNMLAGLDEMKRTLKLKPTSQTKHIGRWTCKVFKGKSQGPFLLELENCIVSWSETGIRPSEIQTLKSMYQFLSQFNTGGGPSTIPQLIWNKKGFPIESLSKVNGTSDFLVVIHEIGKKNVSPTIFKLPKYKIQDFKANYPVGWDSDS